MKNLLEILKENPDAVELREKYKGSANVQDHPDFTHNGDTYLYSLVSFDIRENKAILFQRNAWGGITDVFTDLHKLTIIY